MNKSASATLVASAIMAISPNARAQAPIAGEARLCEQVTATSTATEQARADARSIIAAKSGSATAAFLNGCLILSEGKPDKAADFFSVAANREAKSLYFDWLGRA